MFGVSAKALGVHPSPLPDPLVPNQWLTFEARLRKYAADKQILSFVLPDEEFDCATAAPLVVHEGERLVVRARVPTPDEKVSAMLTDCQPLDP